MKKATNMMKVLLMVAMVAFLVSGCLITEIIQSVLVAAGGVFETRITITDKTADANAYKGALCILVPDDWEFISGTYNSQVGVGSFELDPATPPLYGDIDAKLPPPAGMKWIRLLSDAAYANGADVVHEATIQLKAGARTGTFPIGYLVTKNTVDMLNSINPLDIDNDNAWADTSMNHMVTVTGATAPAVLLNEAYSRGTAENPDWVELYNSANDTLDISGWLVYDNGGQAGTKPKKAIPAGTLLLPKGFYVIVVDNTGDPSDFGLGSGGDKVWLENTAGAVVDSVEFGALQATESYSRIPDGGVWQVVATITRGTSNGIGTGVARQAQIVETYRLEQNYPNPFNPMTQISFYLPKATQVSLTVYNLLGQAVREVVNSRLAAGAHSVTFDAADLKSGVYFYAIKSAEFSATRRMVLIK